MRAGVFRCSSPGCPPPFLFFSFSRGVTERTREAASHQSPASRRTERRTKGGQGHLQRKKKDENAQHRCQGRSLEFWRTSATSALAPHPQPRSPENARKAASAGATGDQRHGRRLHKAGGGTTARPLRQCQAPAPAPAPVPAPAPATSASRKRPPLAPAPRETSATEDASTR